MNRKKLQALILALIVTSSTITAPNYKAYAESADPTLIALSQIIDNNSITNQASSIPSMTDDPSLTIDENITSNDFESNFYVVDDKKSSNVLQINSISDKISNKNVLAFLNLSKLALTAGDYIDYEVTTTDTSNVDTTKKYTYSNIEAKEYYLPGISTTNINKITVVYNLKHKDGSVAYKSKQVIKASTDTVAPALKITNVNYSLGSSSSSATFNIKVTDTSVMLSKPALYIGGTATPVENADINYDKTNNEYTVTIKNLSQASWKYDFFASDDSFNVSNVTFDSTILPTFDIYKGSVLTDKDFNLRGTLPSGASSAYINTHAISDNAFVTKLAQGETNLSCNYTCNNYKVNYSAKVLSDNQAPTFSDIKGASSISLTSDNKMYVKSTDNFTLDGKITDNYISSGMKIDSIDYLLNDYDVKSVDLKDTTKFTYSDGTFHALLDLTNTSDNDDVTVIIKASDKFNNQSQLIFDVIVDKTIDTPTINLKPSYGVYADKTGCNFNGSVTPSITTSEPNLDKQNSKIIIKKYINSDDKNPTTYLDTNFNDSLQLDSSINNTYSLKNSISDDGKYEVTTHLVDLAGNQISPDSIRTFYIDKTAPIIKFTDTFLQNNDTVYEKSITPTVTITDLFLTKSDIINTKYVDIKIDGNTQTLSLDDVTPTINKDGSTTYSINLASLPEGHHTLSVKTIDHSNNRSTTNTKDIYVDTTAPVVSQIMGKDDLTLINNNYYRTPFNPYITVDEANIDKVNSFFIVTKDGLTTLYDFNSPQVNEVDNGDGTKNYILNNVVDSDASYTITEHVQDEAGNIQNTPDDISTFYIDSISKPTISNVPSSPTTSDITPIITVSDHFLNKDNWNTEVDGKKYIYAELNGKAYALTFKEKNGDTITFEGAKISANTAKGIQDNLKIFVLDKAAMALNEEPKTTQINFIKDNEAPTISISKGFPLSNNKPNFYNTDVSPEFTITDNYGFSGTPKVTIINRDTFDLIPFSLSKNDDGNYTLNGINIHDDGNYRIAISASDTANNPALINGSNGYVYDFTVDKTKPNVNIDFDDYSKSHVHEGIYYNNHDSVSPKVTISDTNFINSGTKVLLNNEDITSKIDPQSNTFDLSYSAEGKYTIKVVNVDEAGNLNSAESTFVLDRTKPVLKFNFKDGDYISNKNFRPIISTENPEDTVTNVTINWNPSNDPSNLPILKDNNYTISATATDFAGNVSDDKPKSFTIDTTSPSVSKIKDGNGALLIDNSYYRNPFDPYVTVSETNIDKTNSYFIVTKDGITTRYNFDADQVIETYSITGGKCYTLKNVVDSDAAYAITVHVQDKAGNIQNTPDQTSTFYIDSYSAPSIYNIPSDNTSSDITPTITLVDHFLNKDNWNQDINGTKYIRAELNGKPYNLTLKEKIGDTIILEGAKISANTAKGINDNLKVFVLDKAAIALNEKPASNEVNFVKDSENPIISISKPFPKSNNKLNFYNSDVSPEFTITDNYGFSQKPNVSIINKNTGKNVPFILLKKLDGNYTVSGINIHEDGNYKITIDAVDTAGNPALFNGTQGYAYNFTVDQTTPGVSINFDDYSKAHMHDGIYYNNHDSVSPKIVISDTNFINSGTKVYLNSEDITSKIDPESNTFNLTYYAEGKYTIAVVNTDEAGNTSSTNSTFIIDRTKPIVSKIKTENDNLLIDNEYYRNPFNPYVTVTEANIDKENSYFNVTKDGKTTKYDFNADEVSEVINSDGSKNYILKNVVDNDAAYTITAHVQDKAENMQSTPDQTSTFCIDSSTIPTISEVPSTPTSSDITPVITVVDHFLNKDNWNNDVNGKKYIYAELDGKAYALNFKEKVGDTITFEGDKISANTAKNIKDNLKVFVLDKGAMALNETPKTAEINFIKDSTAPTISISKDFPNSINKPNFYNSDVTPEFTISDNYAFSDTPKVSIIDKDTGEAVPFNLLKNADGNYTLNGINIHKDGNYKITISASDTAGNLALFNDSQGYEYEFTVDQTKPDIKINLDDYSKSHIHNGIYYNNHNSVSPKIVISDTNFINSGTKVFLNDEDITSKIDPKSSTFDLSYYAEGKYTIEVVNTDEAGNSNSTKSTFVIDRTKPVLDYNYNEGDYINTKNFKPVISTEVNEDTVDKVKINGTYYDPKHLPILTDKNYTISAVASDFAGNITEDIPKSFTIDTTPPVVSNIKTKNDEALIDNRYYRNPFNPYVTVTETNIDKTNSYFNVTKDGETTKYDFNDSQVSEVDNGNGTKNYILKNVVNSDAEYTITVHVQDKAKNNQSTPDQTSTFYIDSYTVPSIKNVPSNPTSSDITPIITVVDHFLNKDNWNQEINGKKYIYAELNGKPYALYFKEKVGDTITFEGAKISANTARGIKDNLKVFLLDKGAIDLNESPATDEVNFVKDSEVPTISISKDFPHSANKPTFYNSDVSPEFAINDNYGFSGTPKVSIINKNTGEGVPFNLTETSNGNYKLSGINIHNDGNYRITISATDTAGNIALYNGSEGYSYDFTVDQTKPDVKINLDDYSKSHMHNGMYYNNHQSVSPEIVISDTNFISSGTKIYLNDQDITSQINPSTNTFNLNYYAEGKYTIEIVNTDEAGNTNSTKSTLIIDRTKPILKFNFNDGNYINTKNFRPIITTELSEDMIDNVNINGNDYIRPGILPTLSDNKYTISAVGSDFAGNISDQVTKMFTLDTTPPNVTIFGLLEGLLFYNKNITLGSSQSDTNQDILTMTLNGAPYHGEPISAENEYTFIATAIDKAKNVTEKTIKFVIDKTAPTVDFGNIKDNEFYNHVIQPIIKYSDAYGCIPDIKLDGEPYNNQPIDSEGPHTLVVKLTDKAGNVRGPIVFKFYIKTTGPRISVSGIMDGATYIDTVTPQIAVEGDIEPTITLDGASYKKGDAITTPGKHILKVTAYDPNYKTTSEKIVKFTIKINGKNSFFGPNKTILSVSGGALSAAILGVLGFFKLKKLRKPRKASNASDNDNPEE